MLVQGKSLVFDFSKGRLAAGSHLLHLMEDVVKTTGQDAYLVPRGQGKGTEGSRSSIVLDGGTELGHRVGQPSCNNDCDPKHEHRECCADCEGPVAEAPELRMGLVRGVSDQEPQGAPAAVFSERDQRVEGLRVARVGRRPHFEEFLPEPLADGVCGFREVQLHSLRVAELEAEG